MPVLRYGMTHAGHPVPVGVAVPVLAPTPVIVSVPVPVPMPVPVPGTTPLRVPVHGKADSIRNPVHHLHVN